MQTDPETMEMVGRLYTQLYVVTNDRNHLNRVIEQLMAAGVVQKEAPEGTPGE